MAVGGNGVAQKALILTGIPICFGPCFSSTALAGNVTYREERSK
jgi:hypothetical protein